MEVFWASPTRGRQPRIEDICVRSESLWSRVVPYWSCYSAHVGYWKNPTVLRRTAALIRDIIETPAEDLPLDALQAALQSPAN